MRSMFINQALVKSGLYRSLIETQKEGYTVGTAIGEFLEEKRKIKKHCNERTGRSDDAGSTKKQNPCRTE